VAEIKVKRLQCCGFRRTGKAMGQVYQLVEDMSRNKCFFGSNVNFLSFIAIFDPLPTLPLMSMFRELKYTSKDLKRFVLSCC
jgi:hypothetical protein